jgi:hypothetical protein
MVAGRTKSFMFTGTRINNSLTWHKSLAFHLCTHRLFMPSNAPRINIQVFRSPSLFLATHITLFKKFQEEFNIVYPYLTLSVAQEIAGSLPDDTLWITCAPATSDKGPDLVLSCSSDSRGNKLPIFIASPHPSSVLKSTDFLLPRLRELAKGLHNEVKETRVFSVFALAPITVAFSQLWTEQTGIACVPQPYYSATYAICTKNTFRNKELTMLGDTTYNLRLGNEGDFAAVSKLCRDFASTSVGGKQFQIVKLIFIDIDQPPFVLSDEGASAEAKSLIAERKVWVHTISRPGASDEIASIVAVTRESASVAAITKVYTDPRWRGLRCAERLVRYVTKL